MSTEEPALAYYRWNPDLPLGTYDNPHFGQLTPGRIVEVRAHQLALVVGQPDWEKATRKQHENQPTFEEERDAFLRPVQAEEE